MKFLANPWTDDQGLLLALALGLWFDIPQRVTVPMMLAAIPRTDIQLHKVPAILMQNWRPVRKDHNFRRFYGDTERLLESLERIADQRPQFGFQHAETSTSVDHSSDQRMLGQMRSWMEDAARCYPAIQRELLRNIPELVPRFIRLFEAAQRKTKELRAIYAFLLEEGDDEDLGFQFIPPPPPPVEPCPSLPLDGFGEDAGELEVRCSEAAAAQLAKMKAMATGKPNGAYAAVWQGLEYILSDLHDPAFAADGGVGEGERIQPAVIKLGRALVLYACSHAAEICVVLMLGSASSGNDAFRQEASARGATGEWKMIEQEIAIRQQFHLLVAAWRADTMLCSSLDEIVLHPAYRKIIQLGRPAVSLIIRELRKTPDHWATALAEITGENPVDAGSAGNLSAIQTAWLDWAEATNENECA